MSLASKIEIYTNKIIDFKNEVQLQDNGQGAVISYWNVDGLTQPTTAQLDALQAQAEIVDSNNAQVNLRVIAYGTPAQQLEWITQNGLQSWIDNVATIKAMYPKQ